MGVSTVTTSLFVNCEDESLMFRPSPCTERVSHSMTERLSSVLVGEIETSWNLFNTVPLHPFTGEGWDGGPPSHAFSVVCISAKVHSRESRPRAPTLAVRQIGNSSRSERRKLRLAKNWDGETKR